MRLHPQCVPCIFSVRAREILASSLEGDEKIRRIAGLMRLMGKLVAPGESTITVATRAFEYVKEVTGVEDPYAQFKEASNRLALSVVPSLERVIAGKDDYERFFLLALATVNANKLDPGAPPYSLKPSVSVELLLEGSFRLNDLETAYREIKGAGRVAYVLDNAGESVIDVLLVREISRLGVEVIVVAKSKPYQNDTTADEALALGFDRYARVVGTGYGDAGIIPHRLSLEARKAFETSDLVIAKGMANYEAMHYFRPPWRVLHLLVAKCDPVASSLGVARGDRVAKLIEWERAT